MLGGRVGLLGLVDSHFQCAVNQGPLVQVVPVHKGHRDACFIGTSRAANAVEVGFFVLGDGVVNHVGDIVHVDSAGGHVGGNQDVFFALFKRHHRAFSRVLAEIAVDGCGQEPAVIELFDQPRRTSFGAGKDDGLSSAFCLQDPTNHFVFIQLVGAIDKVFDVCLGEGFFRVVGSNMQGLGHKPPGECQHRPRHGGRKQHGVPGLGRMRKQPLHIG